MGTTYNITIIGNVENETKLKAKLEEILDSVNIFFLLISIIVKFLK